MMYKIGYQSLPERKKLVMWLLFALLSALFAALTSILAKIGIEGVNSNLATAIRTVVVVAMAWGMVFLTHTQSGISDISKKSWIFLILSGLATGASWFYSRFCRPNCMACSFFAVFKRFIDFIK